MRITLCHMLTLCQELCYLLYMDFLLTLITVSQGMDYYCSSIDEKTQAQRW